jgi:hypothetical protein
VTVDATGRSTFTGLALPASFGCTSGLGPAAAHGAHAAPTAHLAH